MEAPYTKIKRTVEFKYLKEWVRELVNSLSNGLDKEANKKKHRKLGSTTRTGLQSNAELIQ